MVILTRDLPNNVVAKNSNRCEALHLHSVWHGLFSGKTYDLSLGRFSNYLVLWGRVRVKTVFAGVHVSVWSFRMLFACPEEMKTWYSFQFSWRLFSQSLSDERCCFSISNGLGNVSFTWRSKWIIDVSSIALTLEMCKLIPFCSCFRFVSYPIHGWLFLVPQASFKVPGDLSYHSVPWLL